MSTVDLLLWLVAAVTPGAALIRLCQPATRWLALGCAPAVSFGFCYAIGLACSRVSVSPVAGVLIGTAVLVLATVVIEVRRSLRARRIVGRRLGTGFRLASRSTPVLLSWLLLAVGVLVGTLQWRSFQSTMLTPVGWDAMHHGYFIEQISRFHTMKSSVVLSSDTRTQDGSGTFYPLAFNLVAASLHACAGGAVSTLMLASTVAVAGVLLPLGSYALAIELDPGRPLVAGFAAITPVLPLMLYLIEGTGRLTGVLGVAVLPGLVALLIGERGATRWTTLPLAVLGILGVTGLHTSEAPLAVLMAVCFVLVWAVQEGDRIALGRWLGWLVAGCVIAVVGLVALEPDVMRLVSERGGAILPPTRRPVGQALAAARAAIGGGWLLAMAGCLVTVLPRWQRYRGAALALLGLVSLYLLSAIGLRSLVPTLTIPWYGDPGRLSWDLTVVSAIPFAVGLAAVAGLVGRLASRVVRFVMFDGEPAAVAPEVASDGLSDGVDASDASARRPTDRPTDPLPAATRWAPAVVVAITGLLLILAFALPPVGRQGRLASSVAGPVDRNSQAAFGYLAAHVPAGQQVLDDLRTDGAMWMYVDHGVQPVFGNSPLLGLAPHSWLERLWLSRNLKNIDTDPCVRFMLAKYSIHYIYAGDVRIFDGWSDFRTPQMLRDPAFTQVFHQGAAHVFTVDPTGPVSCNRDVTVGVRWG